MTPGCTTQSCDFTEILYKFDNLKATITAHIKEKSDIFINKNEKKKRKQKM